MSNETIVTTPRSRWSVKRSASTAGLALLLTSAGAIGAAVALPAGSTGADTGRMGGGRAGWAPPQNQQDPSRQGPNQQGQSSDPGVLHT